jgi:glycosyltransferase
MAVTIAVRQGANTEAKRYWVLRITIICASLNAASTIAETIASVGHAGECVEQLVIVDGGSTDGTVEVVRAHESLFDGRLTLISEPDEGLYFALNRGLELATGEYVLFLGADDALAGGAIDAISVAVGEARPDLIFGDVEVVGVDGSKWVQQGCEAPGRVGGIPRAMPVCHQASLYSADVMRRLGGFDTRYRIASDYDLYLRFLDADTEWLYVPVVIAEFRLGGASSRDGIATAAEYRDIWMAHGVKPTRATLRMWRSIANLYLARVPRWWSAQ